LRPDEITEAKRACIRRLNEVARGRGRTLAQRALAWVLRHPQVTSALIGASRLQHIEDNVAALQGPPFAAEDLNTIDQLLSTGTPPTHA